MEMPPRPKDKNEGVMMERGRMNQSLASESSQRKVICTRFSACFMSFSIYY